MRRFIELFNQIIQRLRAWVGWPSAFRPEDIPKHLTPQALAEVLREANFLRTQHGVEVKTLEPLETPGPPRPAKESGLP